MACDNVSTCNFGEHVTIDGYRGDFAKLNDRGLVLRCLEELTLKLDMKKLADAQVYCAPDTSGKDPGGWSGFIVVAESHISIHTFPRRGFLSADVYSCKNGLNVDFIVDYFKTRFELQNTEINFFKRGTQYPAENLW